MIDTIILRQRLILRCVQSALAGLALAGCTSLYVPAEGEVSQISAPRPWQGMPDCFRKDVAVNPWNAAEIATGCSGARAGGDPGRTGRERAAAYFNSAAAYNVLADAGGAGAPCETRSDCHYMALRAIRLSYANQEDGAPAVREPPRSAGRETEFILRRRVEHARSLRGVSEASAEADDACGSASDCIREAGMVLELIDASILADSENSRLGLLTCEGVSLRAGVNAMLGQGKEHLMVADLERLVLYCPSYAASASASLSRYALAKANTLLEGLDAAGGAAISQADGQGVAGAALLFYRQAYEHEADRPEALRGIGRVHLLMANAAPEQAEVHLRSAIDAFESMLRLTASSGQVRVSDIDSLGHAYSGLARLVRDDSTLEREALLAGAVRYFEQAVALAPTWQRRLQLANAYDSADLDDAAIEVYREILAAQTHEDTTEPALALARLLEADSDPDAALEVIETALLGKADPLLRYEAGRLRFLKGDHGGALSLLKDASLVGEVERRAEAFYMMSVSESILRRKGWQARAFDYAHEALVHGGRHARFVRQDCLAYIQAGLPQHREDTTGQLHCQAGDTPESFLLQGMVLLKEAQLTEVSAYAAASQNRWRSLVGLASDAFLQGQEALSGAISAQGGAWFDDLGREVEFAVVLADGLRIVRRCRREISIPMVSAEWQRLEDFFGNYGILRCSPG